MVFPRDETHLKHLESLSGYIMGPAAADPPFFLCNDWF